MKKISKLIIVIVIILLLILFVKKSNVNINQNGNSANMGLVVKKDDNIYYNKYEKGIFKIENGEEIQLTNETAYSLNVIQDKIYYLTVADFNDVIIKYVDLKNNEIKALKTIYTSISKIYNDSKNLYYATNQNGGGIVKIDIENQNETVLLSDSVQDFQILDGNIFYINSKNQICKANLSDEKAIVLNESIKASKLQVVNNWIYYYNTIENALFRLNYQGNKNELVSVLVKNETYNVNGKYVYYFDQENQNISRMNIGKSNKCDKIVDLKTTKTKINIVDDEMYYLDKSQDESQTYQIYRLKTNGEQTKNIEY